MHSESCCLGEQADADAEDDRGETTHNRCGAALDDAHGAVRVAVVRGTCAAGAREGRRG